MQCSFVGPRTPASEGVRAAYRSLSPPAAPSDWLYLDASVQPDGDVTLERLKEKLVPVRGHGRPTA